MVHPGVLVILLIVGLAVAADLYRRYVAKTETLYGKVVQKTSPGILSRKVYLVTVLIPSGTMEYETSLAVWSQVTPGDIIRLSVSTRHRFIRQVQTLSAMAPEDRIRLERSLGLGTKMEE